MPRRWSPAPDDLVAEADRGRWSRDNPAPGLVGYLIAWRTMRDGGVWTVRRFALHVGWSKWSARRMLARVEADLTEWRSGYSPDGSGHRPDKTSHGPDKTGHVLRVIPGTYEPEPDKTSHGPDKASHGPDDTRARCSTDTHTDRGTDTSIYHSSDSAPVSSGPAPEVAATWKRIEALRAEHLRGSRSLKLTPGRRKHLRARISESSADEVVAVWKWALTSPSPRAAYLREHGFVRPDTLHRASKFHDYAEKAATEAAATDKGASRASAGASSFSSFLADDDRT